MGRDGVLPKKTFGYLKPGSNTPTFNIVLIGVISFAGAVLLNYVGSAYEHAGELLNCGAFLAFMGVNLATFWQFTVARQQGYKTNPVKDVVLPLIGFGACFLIWWKLPVLAKIVGGIWFALGLIYVGIKTRGFRAAPVMIDFSES
jgi:hypothetical protein